MNIGIIGGGSIGLLFSYYLSQSANVTLYTRTAEQAKKINEEGLYCYQRERVIHTRIAAKPFEFWKGQEEITLVTVKQYQLAQVLENIANQSNHKSNSCYLFLQNGMGHIRPLKKLTSYNIFVGSVEHGAYRNGENSVVHNGNGVTRIALLNGDKALLDDFITLGSDSFPIVIEDNYDDMLIKKLIVNSMINPLTAILKVPNGALIKNESFYTILMNVFKELKLILNLENPDDDFAHVLAICEKTANNRSSMLKDLDQNQETEIDAILGYVLEEAELKGMKAPLINMLYLLIKGISNQKGAE
ncbi:2-dehydropantoate 2-reductase [Bacillus sp. T3]|uniref:2-dehydropantoate 2-reductase n=1 Tax=Bacillus sp. T3 TaxID=467262 RepID=UPI00298238F6|nr:2-dehydropantoate 2-reductase [Bacillus sp. T3]